MANTISRPTFEIEQRLRAEHGYVRIAGTDEAGRGPIAGPVSAAAVVIPQASEFPWLNAVNDSKKLTARQREQLAGLILESCFVGAAMVSHEKIDEIGIVPATRLAMRRAVEALLFLPDFLLVDGMALPDAPCPHEPVIHGDALSLSIACASIIAKVLRDRHMVEMNTAYPGYGFSRNKGYLTEEHRAGLDRLGPSPIHRRSFAPIRQPVAGQA